jgi:transcriptional regulator with XRE-family HTH domain
MASASTPRQIAAAVRQRREELGMTQQEVAASADVSVSSIQSTEAGKFTGRPYTLRKIAAALGLDPRSLLAMNEPYDGSDRRHSARRSSDREQQEETINRLLELPPDELARVLLSLPADRAELVLAAYHQFRAGQVAEPNSAERRSR